LPSASEWEYAARGGNGAVWPTGARLDVEPASAVAGASRRRPAGSFEANSFGLHDMAGGVAEIVRDCWTPTLAGVPTDGTATITRACTERTLKDGAWSGPAKARRASARRPIAIDAAQPGVGFRVVREMR
jgi:formylglycine-generating enzyme required for sulfatase activity